MAQEEEDENQGQNDQNDQEDQGQDSSTDQQQDQDQGQGEQTIPYSRFKEVNDELKQLKEEREKLKSQLEGESEEDKEENATPQQQQDLKSLQERYDFLESHRNEGLLPQDVDLLNKLREEGESLEEVYKRESEVIEAKKKNRQSQDNIPEPSQASRSSGNEPTPEDIAQMSRDEHKRLAKERSQRSSQ